MLSTDLSLGCPLNLDVTNVIHFQGHYRNDPFVVLGMHPPLASLVRLPFARNQIETQLLCVFFQKIPVIQFSGFSPVITTASLKHSSYLQSLGATRVLNRKLSSWWYQNSNRRDHRWGTYQIRLSPCPAHKLPPSKWWTLKDRRYSCCLRRSSRSIGISRVSLRLGSLNTNRDIERNVYEWVEIGIIKVSCLLVTIAYKPNRVHFLRGGLLGIVEGLRRMEYNRVSGVKLVVHPEETPEA